MQSILQAGMRASAKVNCNFLVRDDPMFRPEVINIYSDGNRDIRIHCQIKKSTFCFRYVTLEVMYQHLKISTSKSGMPGWD